MEAEITQHGGTSQGTAEEPRPLIQEPTSTYKGIK